MGCSPLIPDLHFDGQFIHVLWDNYQNAIAWFEEYFGWSVLRREDWKVDPACSVGAMAQMEHGTWLVTYLTETRLAHHFSERGTVESHVRTCFRVRDLAARHERLLADGVRMSPIYDGPKARYFDVWATPEGIRLTLQEDETLEDDGVHPSWVRIGVRDVTEAIRWYESVTGMRLVERENNDRFAIMALKLNHAADQDSLWVLEQLPDGANTDRRSGQVQPVCWIRSRNEFFAYHKHLRSSGVETSEIGGFVERGICRTGDGEFPLF